MHRIHALFSHPQVCACMLLVCTHAHHPPVLQMGGTVGLKGIPLSLRHLENCDFVKSHLCLSWIKIGIVASQSSYSKQFWQTGVVELSPPAERPRLAESNVGSSLHLLWKYFKCDLNKGVASFVIYKWSWCTLHTRDLHSSLLFINGPGVLYIQETCIPPSCL